MTDKALICFALVSHHHNHLPWLTISPRASTFQSATKTFLFSNHLIVTGTVTSSPAAGLSASSDTCAIRSRWIVPLTGKFRPRPLFRTAMKKKLELTGTPMSGRDITRMLKRRLEDAGLPPTLSPHSFRVAVATDLLDQRVPLEDVQQLLGHADARTTKLYDRTNRKVTRNIVERIRLGR